jgi:hypothetical protein
MVEKVRAVLMEHARMEPGTPVFNRNPHCRRVAVLQHRAGISLLINLPEKFARKAADITSAALLFAYLPRSEQLGVAYRGAA